MSTQTENPDFGPSRLAIAAYIARYRNKANVLKQIHSNKAESARNWDLRHTLAVIILGAAITFFGFMGPDRILDSLRSPAPAARAKVSTNPTTLAAPPAGSGSSEEKSLNLGLNVAALLLFVVSLLNLIYRWKERQSSHFNGVVRLTHYVNWLDEITLLQAPILNTHSLREIRARYQSIVESLPPNDEKDYTRAKKSLANKAKLWGKSPPAISLHQEAPEADSDEDFVLCLVASSPLLMHVLDRARETRQDLWLGGGAVRNYVWTHLTGRAVPLDDFDLVYFDSSNVTYEQDHALEIRLTERLPRTIRVSVKNQARMHQTTGEPERRSLSEAVENWPETATCIAVRLGLESKLELMAPHGVEDLLNMVLRPTAYHAEHRESYERRKVAKKWQACWPEISLSEDA